MKAKLADEKIISFKPVNITISLETQDELDGLTALCNYVPTNDALRSAYGLDLFKALITVLEKSGGNSSVGKLQNALGWVAR